MNPQVAGAIVAERRQRLKFSMRDAATRGGVSVTAWSDLEKGIRPPTNAMQRAVAQAVGWRLDWYDILQKSRRPSPQALLADVDVSRDRPVLTPIAGVSQTPHHGLSDDQVGELLQSVNRVSEQVEDIRERLRMLEGHPPDRGATQSSEG